MINRGVVRIIRSDNAGGCESGMIRVKDQIHGIPNGRLIYIICSQAPIIESAVKILSDVFYILMPVPHEV